MHRIFKAARQCGYLKDVIEPIDAREAKNIAREKIVYICVQEVKVNQWLL